MKATFDKVLFPSPAYGRGGREASREGLAAG